MEVEVDEHDGPGSLVGLALVAVALLDPAWTTVAAGSGATVAPAAAALGPVDRAIDAFLDTLAAAYVSAADEALPPLALDRLRENGIPTVDDDQYVTAATATSSRRHLLAGSPLDSGWELPTTTPKESRA